MSLNITRMRLNVKKPLGIEEADVTTLPDADIDELLNFSLWELTDKLPFKEKERTLTFTTVAGVRNYDFPVGTDAIRMLSIRSATGGQFTKLLRMESDEYHNRFDEEEWARAFPTHYVPEYCLFRLWPTPDQIYTMTMKRLIVIADLATTGSASSLPRSWDEIIIQGAVWRGFLNFGEYDRSQAFKAHQIALINSAVPVESKEEKDSREAALVPQRPSYNLL